jgi:6-phospho-beta-glucosidase
MRLTILGGGGFRVPLVYDALLHDHEPGRVTELVLHDIDPARLRATVRVLAAQADGVPDAPRVTATAELDEALTGADFIFSAIRVGGTHGRVVDERVALAEGVLGQETVGAGGVAYGLRTVPVARDIALRVAAAAPQAWVINFTNPASMVTEAMAEYLGDRVIGICDSPLGVCRRVARTLQLDPDTVRFDYAGLNHLGWVRAAYVDGRDVLPDLLADADLLGSFEEGKLFGAHWLQVLGSVPNEYLHYYYFTREAIGAARCGDETRGEFLLHQQERFYADLADDRQPALKTWQQTRMQREMTYMAESRAAAGIGERDACDLESAGYQDVALALMRAIAHDQATMQILNVRNRATLAALDADAVIEVPCHVDGAGARPMPTPPLDEHQAGLVCSVKAVERAVIEAATTSSRAAALRAFAIHPLVDSVAVAERMLDSYQQQLPALAYLRR